MPQQLNPYLSPGLAGAGLPSDVTGATVPVSSGQVTMQGGGLAGAQKARADRLEVWKREVVACRVLYY